MNLNKLADFQRKNYGLVIILAIIFTAFMLVGASKIYMQSDITKEWPQDLEIMEVQDQINNLYGVGDSVLITLRLDPDFNIENRINDIRDPYVIQSLMLFEEILEDESAVDSVTSASMFFENKPIYTTEMVKMHMDQSPASYRFFNDDYSATLMIVSASIGKDITKIKKIIDRFEENKDETFLPPGVEIHVTGMPFILNVILTFLQQDAVFTTALAALIILLLLFLMERSFSKGFIIFIPLTLGLVWTLGTLGWLNIPISVATVGVGAMILGLGVEYGVFVVSRYAEERKKHKQDKALQISVSEVGSSILGSGLTTIVGFSALTLSVMPMMQHLGQSLALGIFFSLVAALVVNPAFIIFEEDLEKKLITKAKKRIILKEKEVASRK
ncbi:hypothetical protein BVX95_00495 [archaeon D22]|nr:hypothetical protein BVX95_00495 [archaeon D22]